MSASRKARGGVSFVVRPQAIPARRAPMRVALAAVFGVSLALWGVAIGGIGRLAGWW